MTLSQESAAAIHAEVARAVQPLHAQIEALDEFASGVHLALWDVVTVLLLKHPELHQSLVERWRPCAEEFGSSRQDAADPQSDERLECRKMLYEFLSRPR